MADAPGYAQVTFRIRVPIGSASKVVDMIRVVVTQSDGTLEINP